VEKPPVPDAIGTRALEGRRTGAQVSRPFRAGRVMSAPVVSPPANIRCPSGTKIRNPQSAIRNPQSKPQPLQRVGSRITGRGNILLGLETAHGFDGGLIVYAGQFAGVEAALFERLLNLERARPVDFEGLASCEKVRVGL
jgi:hypothetical protein